MKLITKNLRPRLSLLFALFAASGCGLSDYQNRMDAQRQRVQEFDAANSLLDDPILMPKIQLPQAKDGSTREGPAWPFDVYLRLPSGLGIFPREKAPYHSSFNPFPCFRYASGDVTLGVFVVAAKVAEPKAKEEPGHFTPADFRIRIREAMEDFYSRTFKVRYTLQPKGKARLVDKKPVAAYPDGPALKYEYLQYTDDGNKEVKSRANFDVYVHERYGKQVAIIVYHLAKQDGAGYLTARVDACLGTLDISNEAANKRLQFKK